MFGNKVNTKNEALIHQIRELRDDLATERSLRKTEQKEAESRFKTMVEEKDAESRLAVQIATEQQTKELIETKTKLEVANKEIELLKSINELDGDVLDVKNLVTKLIDKLPEIKISSLSMATSEKKE